MPAVALPRPLVSLALKANARGDLVVAVRDFSAIPDTPGSARNVRVFTGSITDPRLSGPIEVDGATAGDGVSVALSEDGSAAVVYGDQYQSRIVRRSGTGPFGAPQSAVCGEAHAGAYLADGRRSSTAARPGTSRAGRCRRWTARRHRPRRRSTACRASTPTNRWRWT